MSEAVAKRPTTAFTNVDFDKLGRQIGFVMFPHSPHDDAWGVTRIPIAIQGRLILMPANNVHAVIASRRTSPIDGLNFNRTFPGDPAGTITQQISAYVADHIFPIGDSFLDLHSGGSSLAR